MEPLAGQEPDAFEDIETVLNEAYPEARSRADGLDIHAETLHTFSEDADLKPVDGVILSALAGTVEGSVTLPGLGGIDYVGIRNETGLTVEGDIGEWAGARMNDGTLHVQGDAGDHAAYRMEGGTLRIEGDAGDRLGQEAAGGTVTVRGDAGRETAIRMDGGEVVTRGAGRRSGMEMRGGTLRIEGDGDSGMGMDMEGGTIYVDGRFYISRRRQMAWDGGTIYVREDGEYVPFLGDDT